MSRLRLLALAAALGGATVLLGTRLEEPRDRPYDIGILPASSALRWASLGHPLLVANLFWLRTVQYIGEPRGDRRGWDKLFPVVDLVTDLDPRHGYAYQVAGNVLGAVGRVDEANRILEKGTRNRPDRYILPFHRAVNAMLYAGDYVEAARWFEVASRVPGAPEHMREYVLSMYVKGEEAGGAVTFLQHLLDTATDDESRRSLERQLLQARVEQAAAVIDAAVERFRERYVLPPVALEQLVFTGVLREIPPDPAGGTWVLDDEGRAHSTISTKRFQRPMTAEDRRSAIRALSQGVRSQGAKE
jgi:tetratricopeptide (TPR) repeat protein